MLNEVKLSYRKFDFSKVESGDYVIITPKSKDGSPTKPFIDMYRGSDNYKIVYEDYESDYLKNIEKITKLDIEKQTFEEIFLC